MLSRSLGSVCTRRATAGDGRRRMLCRGRKRPRAARRAVRSDSPHPGLILPNLPLLPNGVGVLVKLRRGHADTRRTSGRCEGDSGHRQRGAGSSLAARRRRRAPARRERQHGAALDRRRAHRRPPQPRRPPPLPRRRRPRAPAAATRATAAAHPGDFAELRRQTQDLRSVAAGRAGPHVAARRRPARSAGERRRARCATSPARRAATCTSATASRCGSPSPWRAASWTRAARAPRGPRASGRPSRATPRPPRVTCMRATDGRLTRRARQAMQRRGCRSLAWAPMVLRGELVGAIELSDAGDRDFSRHADVLGGLARDLRRGLGHPAHHATSSRTATRPCASWSTSPGRWRRRTTSSGSSCASRSGCSRAANADCVDVWRASGGVIRLVVSFTRDGVDPSVRDKILDTARYPSLERTLLDHTPLAIGDLRRHASRRGRARAHARLGVRQLADDAAGRRRRARRPGRPLRRRGARLERRTSSSSPACASSSPACSTAPRSSTRRGRSPGSARSSSSSARDLAAAEAPVDIAERAAARLRERRRLRRLRHLVARGGLPALPRQRGRGRRGRERARAASSGSTTTRRPGRRWRTARSWSSARWTTGASPTTSARTSPSSASAACSRSRWSSDDQVVGLIDVFDVRERDYNDVRWFLPEAGRTVADALRNADLLAGLRRGNTALRELVELGDRLNEAGTLRGARQGGRGAAARRPRRRGLRHLAGGRRRAPLPRQRRQPRLGRRRGRVGARARRVRGHRRRAGRQRADGRRRPRRART